MPAERLEANGNALSKEIKALDGVAHQLHEESAAKECTSDIVRQFAGHCRVLNSALETVSIPFRKEGEMLTVLRVTVLAHSGGVLKLQINLGSILEICSELRNLISHRIENSLAQFKTDLTLEFSLNQR